MKAQPSEKSLEEDKESSKSRSDKVNNDIDFFRILSGEEKRTTVMIRNIPNKFKQMTLLEMINKNHDGRYDYFYLPMDLKVPFIFINKYINRHNAMWVMHL